MKKGNVTFQIVRLGGMTKHGLRMWRNDPRVSKTVRRGVRIEELKLSNGGIPAKRVNTKQKLAAYVYSHCGAGVFDIMVYRKKKNQFHSSPHTAIRITIDQADEFGDNFILSGFDTSGESGRFKRRFGMFKRIVGWEDDD